MHRISTTLVAALLAASLAVLTPAAAHAGATTRRDPADTQGRLDLSRITLKTMKKAGRTKVVGKVATHRRFSKDDLDNANSLRVVFKLRPHRFRGVRVWYLGDDLTATLCTYDSATQTGGSDCSTHRVRRTRGNAVRFVVPRAAISRKKVLRWRGQAVAWDRSAGCRTAPSCDDRLGAGGNGFFRWRP